MAGSDILLIFGVQKDASAKNIHDDLEGIISKMEPFKIKVQLDESSKKSIKDELSNLMKGFTTAAKSSAFNIKPNILFDQKSLNTASGKLLDNISKGFLSGKATPLLFDSKVAAQESKKYAATSIKVMQDSFKAAGTSKFLTDKMTREFNDINKAFKKNLDTPHFKQLESSMHALYEERERLKAKGTLVESDMTAWNNLIGETKEYIAQIEEANNRATEFKKNVEEAGKAQQGRAKAENVFEGYKAQLENFQKIFNQLSAGSVDENGTARLLGVLQGRIEEMKNTLSTFSAKDFIGENAKNNIKILEQEAAQIDKIIAKTRDKENAYTSANNHNMASTKQVASAYKQLNSVLENNKKAMGTQGYQELADIVGRLQNAYSGAKGSKTNLLSKDFDDLIARASQLQAGFTEAGVAGQTLGAKIKAMYAKFGGWSIITMTMMKLRQVLRDAVQDVVAIDTAMTELKRVTNESDATYEKFLSGAADRARTVGTSIKETVNATADFARLGYSIGDASELADIAVMYKNVGDGIDDVGTATQSIISTMKAFNMETSDSMHVVDAFDKTGEKHCPAA